MLVLVAVFVAALVFVTMSGPSAAPTRAISAMRRRVSLRVAETGDRSRDNRVAAELSNRPFWFAGGRSAGRAAAWADAQLRRLIGWSLVLAAVAYRCEPNQLRLLISAARNPALPWLLPSALASCLCVGYLLP